MVTMWIMADVQFDKAGPGELGDGVGKSGLRAVHPYVGNVPPVRPPNVSEQFSGAAPEVAQGYRLLWIGQKIQHNVKACPSVVLVRPPRSLSGITSLGKPLIEVS